MSSSPFAIPSRLGSSCQVGRSSPVLSEEFASTVTIHGVCVENFQFHG